MEPVKSQSPQSDVLVDFLSEFANHLLASGVAVSEFRRASQAAFVQAALRSARLGNSRINQSAVAALTGLSRLQVRALLRNPSEQLPTAQSRMDAIVSGWRSDPDFTDEDGKPRVLALAPGRNSFSSLTRKYGGDVSHRALLTELARMGYVREKGGAVVLKNATNTAKQRELTRLLSQGLTHLIRMAPSGTSRIVHVIVGEAKYAAPDDTSRLLLRRRLAQGTKAFTADIQAAGDAIASRRTRKSRGRKLSTRVLLVTVD